MVNFPYLTYFVLPEVDSDEEDEPEEQHSERAPKTSGQNRRPYLSTITRRNQSSDHRRAPQVQNKQYRRTKADGQGRYAESDSDYTDMQSPVASPGHSQARRSQQRLTTGIPNAGARHPSIQESDGNGNENSQSHFQGVSAPPQGQSPTKRPDSTRSTVVPPAPQNSPAPLGTRHNAQRPSLRQRVIDREHRDQGERTDADQVLEWQIENRLSDSNEDW